MHTATAKRASSAQDGPGRSERCFPRYALQTASEDDQRYVPAHTTSRSPRTRSPRTDFMMEFVSTDLMTVGSPGARWGTPIRLPPRGDNRRRIVCRGVQVRYASQDARSRSWATASVGSGTCSSNTRCTPGRMCGLRCPPTPITTPYGVDRDHARTSHYQTEISR